MYQRMIMAVVSKKIMADVSKNDNGSCFKEDLTKYNKTDKLLVVKHNNIR